MAEGAKAREEELPPRGRVQHEEESSKRNLKRQHTTRRRVYWLIRIQPSANKKKPAGLLTRPGIVVKTQENLHINTFSLSALSHCIYYFINSSIHQSRIPDRYSQAWV